jgi:hypothetical protein
LERDLPAVQEIVAKVLALKVLKTKISLCNPILFPGIGCRGKRAEIIIIYGMRRSQVSKTRHRGKI